MRKKIVSALQSLVCYLFILNTSAQTNNNSIININIFGGTAPFSNTEWNNWNLPANRISPILKYADGSNSTVTITSNIALGVTDNGTPYPTTMCPPEVGRFAMLSSTGPHTLTFSNLKNDGTVYDIEIYASRRNTGNITRFTINTTFRDINTASNYSNAAIFTGLLPNSSRQIVITITRAAGTYAYVNGLKLVERSARNQPPVVNTGANQTITLPVNSVSLNGTATDSDGTIASRLWSKINGPAAFTITSPASLQTTITGLSQGTYEFELAVTDDDGDTARDTVSVTVNPEPPNIPPVVNAGANQTITLPVNSVSFNGTATDSDGTIASRLWSKINGPAAFTITSPASLQTTITGLSQGTYEFELAVTDDDGDTTRDTVSVTVNPEPPNIPPVVNAGANQTITLPVNSVSLNGTATDSDGTIASRLWSKISGPAAFTITSPASLQTTITGLSQGIYDFELIATDDDGDTGKDTVRITVNPEPPSNPTTVANMTVDSFPRSAQYETYGLTKLPPGYAFSGGKRYPLLLWLHESGEGAGVSNSNSTKGNKTQLIRMANSPSPVQWIANGWNLTAVNPKTGLRDTFIVVAPQHYNNWSYSYNELRFILPNILSRYRIDTTRIYMMGISAGGSGINTCLGSRDSVFINRIAAAVTMISAGVNPASGPAGSYTALQVETNLRLAARYGPRVWTIAGEGDSFLNYDLSLHNNLNNTLPAPRMKFTVWAGFEHVTNGPWLDTNRRPITNYYGNTGTCNNGCAAGGVPVHVNNNGSLVRGKGVTQDSLNILEWLLLYQRTTAATAIPAAVAGNDLNISLPAMSVTLNGTGSTPGNGAVFTSVSWEKLLGPSTGTITSPNNLSTTVTGLGAGNYVFRLRVTNSLNLSHTDEVRVTVNNNVNHGFPSVTITSPQTQNIGVSGTTISAEAVTIGTGIKSVKWLKLKTPSQTPKKYVWLGSSTLAGSGASTADSSIYNRILSFGEANGLFSSNVNLALTGTSIFQCMPSTYTPQGTEDAPLTDRNITFALSNHPDADAIVISYPSNDYDELETGRILFAYQTIYDSAAAAGKKCYIYTPQPRETFGPIARLRLREIADSLLVREQRGRFAAGTIINVHAPLTDLNGELMLYDAGDGIHQNNTGHRIIANNTIGSAAFFPVWANSSSVITSPGALSTTITGLTNGTHVFMISVTDNYEHTVYATTTINVSGLNNQLPVVNAGNNQSITLPSNSITLNGSAADADGTISSVQWSKVSGPAQFSITSTVSLQTQVTGLVQGVYDFELRATDNNGGTGIDTVRITVNAAPYAIPSINAGNGQTITLPASTVSLTSVFSITGASFKSLQWSKTKTPSQLAKRVVWIGSSTLAGTGASTEDSAVVWRVGNYYTRIGVMSSWLNLAVGGSNIFHGMPTGYSPTGNQNAPDINNNVTAALNQGADIVIVGYPSNAYDGPLSITEIMFAYRTIYNTVVNAGKKCYIMTSQPRPAFGTAGRNMLKQVTDSIMAQFPDNYIQAYYSQVQTGTHNMLYNSGDNIHLNNTGHRVLFNSVVARNIFETWATSSAVITTPNATNTSITGLTTGTHIFQVSVTDTHEQSATDTVQITVRPEPGITANAGADQVLQLPASSITLSGTASEGGVSFLWRQLNGPGTTSITNPTAVTTTVTGFTTAGTYFYELALNGSVSRDTVQVTVNAPGGGNGKVINVNIFGGSNPFNNIQWNNWNIVANRISQQLKYSDGTNSPVIITSSIALGVTDNGTPYLTTMCPPEVGRYAMLSSTGAHTLTFSNLKTDGTLYDLEIYASRRNTGNITRFTVNGVIIDINTASNFNNAARFTNVQPNAQGQIIITITRAAGTYAYVNGLKLTEVGIIYVTK